MKTSNKLLLGLILFILLLVTLTVGVATYYHNAETAGLGENNREAAADLPSEQLEEVNNISILSPISFVQLPLSLR